MGDLTAKEVAAKSKGVPGRSADGEGLYFVVQNPENLSGCSATRPTINTRK
jgi:hypothetical protein